MNLNMAECERTGQKVRVGAVLWQSLLEDGYFNSENTQGQGVVRQAQAALYDKMYRDLWEDVAELVGKDTSCYTSDTIRDQCVSHAMKKYGQTSDTLQAANRAIDIMAADIDVRVLLHDVDRVPRYILQQLDHRIDEFLLRDEFCSRNIYDISFKSDANQLEQKPESDKPVREESKGNLDYDPISFEVSPDTSPENSKKYQKAQAHEPAILPKVLKPKITSSTARNAKQPSIKESTSYTAKRNQLKSKNFDPTKAAGILSSMNLKQTPGLSNKDFFASLAKEFNLPKSK